MTADGYGFSFLGDENVQGLNVLNANEFHALKWLILCFVCVWRERGRKGGREGGREREKGKHVSSRFPSQSLRSAPPFSLKGEP